MEAEAFSAAAAALPRRGPDAEGGSWGDQRPSKRGLGYKVVWFRVPGLGCRVEGLGLRVQGLECRV